MKSELVTNNPSKVPIFIGLILGALFIVLGVNGIISYLEKSKSYISTEATVISLGEHPDDESGQLMYQPTFEYYVDGHSYKYFSDLSTATTSLSVGEKITLKYNPDNPREAIFGEISITSNSSVFFIVFGILALTIGLAAAFAYTNAEQASSVIVLGEKIAVPSEDGTKSENLLPFVFGLGMSTVSGYLLFSSLEPVIKHKVGLAEFLSGSNSMLVPIGLLTLLFLIFSFLLFASIFLSVAKVFTGRKKSVRTILYKADEINSQSSQDNDAQKPLNNQTQPNDKRFVLTFASENSKLYSILLDTLDQFTIGESYNLLVKNNTIKEISLPAAKYEITIKDNLENKINKRKYIPVFYLPNGRKIEGVFLTPIIVVIFIICLSAVVFLNSWEMLTAVFILGYLIWINIYYRYLKK